MPSNRLGKVGKSAQNEKQKSQIQISLRRACYKQILPFLVTVLGRTHCGLKDTAFSIQILPINYRFLRFWLRRVFLTRREACDSTRGEVRVEAKAPAINAALQLRLWENDTCYLFRRTFNGLLADRLMVQDVRFVKSLITSFQETTADHCNYVGVLLFAIFISVANSSYSCLNV